VAYELALAAFPLTALPCPAQLTALSLHQLAPYLAVTILAQQVVYERAVAAFPVTHYLWAQYARYLEAHLKINSGACLPVAGWWVGRLAG